jgi:hypothetical protein
MDKKEAEVSFSIDRIWPCAEALLMQLWAVAGGSGPSVIGDTAPETAPAGNIISAEDSSGQQTCIVTIKIHVM